MGRGVSRVQPLTGHPVPVIPMRSDRFATQAPLLPLRGTLLLLAAVLALIALLGGCSGDGESVARDVAETAPASVMDAPAPVALRGYAAKAARPADASPGVAAAAEQSPAAAPSPAPFPAGQAADPMLIKTGVATVEVDSLEVGIAHVRALAQRVGAVVAGTSLQGGKEQVRSASIQLRVPAARFDELAGSVGPLGRLESLNVTTEDVGEEFVDLGARVANARRLEARLIELLATRAGRLADVLAVERELARVREEIERAEGRLRYLRTRAAVSTLTVTVHEPPPVVATRPGERPVRDAFVEAWRRVVRGTAALIVLAGTLVPVAVLGLTAWWLVRRVRRWQIQSGGA